MKARRYSRTPGEQAFDRCFFPIAALFVFGVVLRLYPLVALFVGEVAVGIIGWTIGQSSEPGTDTDTGDVPVSAQIPHSAWLVWFSFALGLVLAILWVRAVAGLIATWADPSARILRFPALVLLVPFACVVVKLLLMPF
jgi:hypothetical protein